MKSDVPECVLTPKNRNEYLAMDEFLDDKADEVVSLLVKTHGTESTGREMMKIWGIWISIQQNLMFHEALEGDVIESDSKLDDVKDEIYDGIKLLCSHFDGKLELQDFLNEGDKILNKSWDKSKTDYIKEIIVNH